MQEVEARRDQWDNLFQFILTLIGYAVGFGNVWRFSYLCAKFGGVTFIVPYLVILVVLGIPLFYLELSLGQAVKKGPVKAWFKISPNLGGIGIAALVVDIFGVILYNLIISWVFFYLFNTFRGDLSWGFCFGNYVLHLDPEETLEILREHMGDPRYPSCFNASTEYFWYNDALGASESINHAGKFNWRIFLCLLLAWVVVYFCLFRGIKLSGKIIYFTATFPYVVLVCLFFRAVTLEGAGTGLKFLFLPSTSRWKQHLLSPQIWLEAASQIFFSLGLSTGGLISLSSYSKPSYNNLVNSVLVPIVNTATSLFISIIVFSIVGFQATNKNSTPELLAKGPGLAFIVFTEAILHMPGSSAWGFLFIFMLLTLGLDTQFTSVDSIITVVYDNKTLSKIRKEIVVGITCLAFFIATIPFILGNGIYLFQLFDHFVSAHILMVGFFEFVAVGWVVGIKRFFTEFANPHKKGLITLWIILWKYVDPIITSIIFILGIVLQIVDPLTYIMYNNYNLTTADEEPPFPWWAQFIGAIIVLLSMLMIPLVLIVRLIAFQSARDEGEEFITRQIASFRELVQIVKQHAQRLIECRKAGLHNQQQDDASKIQKECKTPDAKDINLEFAGSMQNVITTEGSYTIAL